MDNWTQIPTDDVIIQTAEALAKNGMQTEVVTTGEEAKKRVLDLVPEGAEVFTMTSKTLDAIGIPETINKSGKYNSVRNKLMSQDTPPREKKVTGTTPEYAVVSVHALTQDGKAMIASNTGSQLAADVYGADHVIWVVGAQKIVKDMDSGIKRIYEHVLPLEADRANKAYNITSGSFVSKLLVVNKEINPERIKIIIVKEALGF